MLELQNKTLQRILNWGLVMLACVLLVSFTYSDILITVRHGINFWDLLFSGRILHFYQDTNVPSGNLYQATEPLIAGYNFLIHLAFAFWNFPLWLLERFASIDVMNNFLCLVYMKLLPVCATLLCAKLIGKILRETGATRERIKLTQYLYLSSSLILANVLITSRYDSLCSVFMLLSLLYYLRKDFTKFVLFSGIAFCFNYFSFAMFLPLLLLREKNLRKILKSFLMMLLPYIFTIVPFLFERSSLANNSGPTASMFAMLFLKTNGLFSWFTVFYAFIVVYSLLANKENADDIDFVFWLSFVSITSVFAFCFTYPYWPILLVPFLALLIGNLDTKNNILMIMIETIATAGMVGGKMLCFDWCYVGDTFKSMLMSFIVHDRVFNEGKILKLWRNFPNTAGRGFVLLHSFFIAGFLVLAVLCFPKIDKILQKSDFCLSENKLSDILIFRFIVMLGICFVPFTTLIK